MIDWCRLWAALMFYMPNHDETLFLLRNKNIMNYYEPMGFYTYKWDDVFFPVVYVREDGVLERQLNLLRRVGWKIIELSCEKFLKSSGSEEDAMIVF